MNHAAEWQLPTRHIGRRVLLFERLDSTNTHALSLADGPASDGLAIIAAEQTAGRGQHGRIWHSRAGSSVLMSLVLFPDGSFRQPALLTAWAAVSVCILLERIAGLHAAIKWPNDVLVHGQKICGILIEQQLRSGRLATIAGLGLNVNQTQQEFNDADLPFATSLAAKTQQVFDPQVVARALIAILDEHYSMLQSGEFHALETEWQERLNLRGKRVMAEGVLERKIGTLVSLSFQRIELESPEGGRCELRPENVQRLTPL